MTRRRAPDTAAGYFVLHDFRRIDWAAFRERSEAERNAMIDDLETFLGQETDEEGDLACYSVLGHKADLLFLVLRPTMTTLERVDRQLQQLDFSAVTERSTSAIGVTEASGYTEAAQDFFDDDAEADPGIERYMQSRLYPALPDAEFVCFYFMNKRRHPDANWYDLPYEERAEFIKSHGDIGRDYAGRVTQMITGTTGFDDWEWGVTLFANDMVAIKDLLVDMRFDPSTSKFAEFGPFYVGRQFPIDQVSAFLAGEAIGMDDATDETDPELADAMADLDVTIEEEGHAVLVYSEADEEAVTGEVDGLRGNFEHYDSHLLTTVATHEGSTVVVSQWTTGRAADTASGFLEELPGVTEVEVGGVSKPVADDSEDIRSVLEAEGIYAGVPHGEDIHALVLYSEADTDTLQSAVEELATGFDRYDTHECTDVYENITGEGNAVVSLWETEDAAETASGYLQDLPGIFERESEDGFSTMGMFYRTKPQYQEEFRETFEDVGALLGDMAGHRDTDLFANIEDGNDMFIASHWREREDAMEFFRSDAFSDTVQWGRDVLADRPRHVFLS